MEYKFPYRVNPICNGCEQLHKDTEDDNIKQWCDLSEDKKCPILKTYN